MPQLLHCLVAAAMLIRLRLPLRNTATPQYCYTLSRSGDNLRAHACAGVPDANAHIRPGCEQCHVQNRRSGVAFSSRRPGRARLPVCRRGLPRGRLHLCSCRVRSAAAGDIREGTRGASLPICFFSLLHDGLPTLIQATLMRQKGRPRACTIATASVLHCHWKHLERRSWCVCGSGVWFTGVAIRFI